ncbi:hypothetical protein NDU88_005159 [Pleurodeles waltl]|uniref:Uncharacterized protein n=1 Tax=Pleurodeles waltl TaxID=8319 RepID=A0AAV7VMD8_PLEWA|nr:hypothetical protein NDU88_005159 [Pleurodeles waltl]
MLRPSNSPLVSVPRREAATVKRLRDVEEAQECMCGRLALRESDRRRTAGRVRQAAGRDLKPAAGSRCVPRRLRRSGAALKEGRDAADDRGRPAPAGTWRRVWDCGGPARRGKTARRRRSAKERDAAGLCRVMRQLRQSGAAPEEGRDAPGDRGRLAPADTQRRVYG